jgi:hypothetical protein
MGVVVDMNQSKIEFNDPLNLGTYSISSNDLLPFSIHSWDVKFALKFDSNPKNGFGGAPATPELWKIGIVQNLLYENAIVEFDNKLTVPFQQKKVPLRQKTYPYQQTNPAIDADPKTTNLPFYSDPVSDPSRKNTKAVSPIWCTSNGYTDAFDPKNPSKLNISNQPDNITMYDQPGSTVPMRWPPGGSLILSSVQRTWAFQIWLVAIKDDGSAKPVVLATISAFSFAFWLKTKGPPLKHPEDDPDFDYGVYGENGFHPPGKINYGITGTGNSPTVKPIPPNTKNPTLTGDIALNIFSSKKPFPWIDQP